MRRREIVGLLAGLGTLPTVSFAQPGPMRRLAFLHPATPISSLTFEGARQVGNTFIPALLDELRRSGFVEGQSLLVNRYSGLGQTHLYAGLAGEVVASKPDAIFTATTRMVGHLKALTTTIPIVAIMSDPVATGDAASLARPGGNVTGVVSEPGFSVTEKRFELIREVLPHLRSVAVLAPEAVFNLPDGRHFAESASGMGITVVPWALKSPIDAAEYQRAFQLYASHPVDAIIVSDSAENFTNRSIIVQLVKPLRIVGIYASRAYAEAGGLISFGPDPAELGRYAGAAVAKIFAGTPAGEIPFYQPVRFEVVINLKSAEEMGITLPASLVARASEVID